MTWYQDHGVSYNYEDLHLPEEIHQLLPVKTNVYTILHLSVKLAIAYDILDIDLIDKLRI
jgi:hypothetical protein